MCGKRVGLGLGSLIALGFAALSCGDSDGESNEGDYMNTPLAELDGAQRAQACDYLESRATEYYEEFPVERTCTFAAAILAFRTATDEATLRESCIRTRDTCLMQLPPMLTGGPCEFPATCEATLSEIGRCYDDLPAHIDRLYPETPPCEALTLEQAGALMSPEPTELWPASCIPVQAKCSNETSDPPPAEDPLIAACTESCERFEQMCGIVMDPTCTSWCGTEQLLGERNGCLEINQSFYECGRTAALDCAEDSVRLAIDPSCGVLDVTYCQLYEGVTCGREEGFDSYCVADLPELPEAFQCVSSAPYGSCVDHPTFNGIIRCCPTGTTF